MPFLQVVLDSLPDTYLSLMGYLGPLLLVLLLEDYCVLHPHMKTDVKPWVRKLFLEGIDPIALCAMLPATTFGMILIYADLYYGTYPGMHDLPNRILLSWGQWYFVPPLYAYALGLLAFQVWQRQPPGTFFLALNLGLLGYIGALLFGAAFVLISNGIAWSLVIFATFVGFGAVALRLLGLVRWGILFH